MKYVQRLKSRWQPPGGIILALMETFSFVFDAGDACGGFAVDAFPSGDAINWWSDSNMRWFSLHSYVCNTRGIDDVDVLICGFHQRNSEESLASLERNTNVEVSTEPLPSGG